MVLKNKSLDHQFIALSGLNQTKTMTPKIIDASAYISPNNQFMTRKVVKQFNSSNKWQNGSNKLANGNVSPSSGYATGSPEIMQYQQPLKRYSPKWYHSTHYHNHNAMLLQQQQQSQPLIRQQRTSPSRVSPTIAKGPSVTPVNALVSNGGGYAGAKFSEPPSPNELPKPPTHWMSGPAAAAFASNSPGNNRCADISDQIKILLKMKLQA